MTFESGSSMLSASAITDRLLSRSPHFKVVKQPSSFEPSGTSREDQALGTVNNSTVLTYPKTKTFYSSTKSVHYSPTAYTDAKVSFTLCPPTLPRQDWPTLNQDVYSDWIKGTGASWLPGMPHISFDRRTGAFQMKLGAMNDAGSTISETTLEALLDSIENAALDRCVSKHLVEGGDDRLHLDVTGRNKYNCSPYPAPPTTILRCSSTCSPPTRDGFEAARETLRKLWSAKFSFAEAMSQTRASISQLVGVVADHDVILHPSGSDAELIPLMAAMIQAKRQNCSRIINIVAAAGEVGSGTAPASGGRHFSAFAPLGNVVENNGVVNDFPINTDVVELKPRRNDGTVIADYDNLVEGVVNQGESESAGGQQPFYILHAVDGSKTGLRLPSRTVLEKLRSRLGQRCLLVLDACQCRSEPEEFEYFLRRGACILVTSSKFYSAPGFCGAVLVPRSIADDFDAIENPPVGLRDYLTRHEVPHSMRSLRRSLPEDPPNYGLLLRWTCGITEMKMFASMGSRAKSAMRDWVRGVKNLVTARQPMLELVDEESAACPGDATRSGGCNSVVSIRFLTSCGTHHIDCDTLKIMYKHLTNDASYALPSSTSPQERKAASIICLVGQPVKLGSFGVLRLSVGAPLARDVAQPGGLEKALIDDAKILDKMIVLAKYCESLS
eukprot:Plantae.Rhodophyta-Hildenbrandia_rubra.ctg629.p1 GENE.Plantae.Rhodophyta-Hildenbrandia_rubra.ctg629~~Plantae.Rhodophyta-Hildenbrandia_rubra.ctg629.p1  ORF type:complete len:669 (-),score=84.38 Plantae.Rhodophyta-Hildenbrandia_rubra.ctg629:932-2938(-)